MTWFQDHYDELKKYAGKYVAVNNGEVIDQDIDVDPLIGRLHKKYKDISSFAIEFVNDNKIELIL